MGLFFGFQVLLKHLHHFCILCCNHCQCVGHVLQFLSYTGFLVVPLCSTISIEIALNTALPMNFSAWMQFRLPKLITNHQNSEQVFSVGKAYITEHTIHTHTNSLLLLLLLLYYIYSFFPKTASSLASSI